MYAAGEELFVNLLMELWVFSSKKKSHAYHSTGSLY